MVNLQLAIGNVQSSSPRSALLFESRLNGAGSRLNDALPNGARSRDGFTLLELTLALAVLAVVIGLTWPALLRFVGEQDLKENVGQVRAQLSATRMLAIEEGITYQFRFEPQKQRYIVLPYERPLGQPGADATGSATAAIGRQGVQSFELGEDLRFLSEPPGSPTAVVAERLTEDWLRLFGGDAQLAQASWSPAILFLPDGTAHNAMLVVADKAGRYQRVDVRGLTGAVYVGPVEREDRR